LECARTSEAPTGRQAHAAFPSPDGSYILVANQNGKRLERIDSNFASNTFTHSAAATLDLATCKTPSGAACQAPNVRPDNAPICPVISDDGRLAFVTLRGGGMFVVDPKATPMRIVAEYDMATVKGNGCGGAQVGGQMYVNSGGRPGPMEHLHVYGFDVYKFSLDAFRGSTAAKPNTPAPKVVFKADGQHDSHGMVVTGNGRYLWVMDRHADVVEILGIADDARVRTLSLNGTLTSNAAPDLTDVDPSGKFVFTAFRGPTPLSGDPHNAKGDTPGLAVLEVLEGGRNGRLLGLVRLTNVGSDGVERADPHAVRVRRIK
jgi:DNA-binding beta-propeller fold protein YncE